MAMRAAPALPSHHLGQPPLRRPSAPPRHALPAAIVKPRRRFNAAAPMFQLSPISNICVRSSYLGIIKASISGVTSSGGNEDVNEILESSQVENKGPRTMFLAKLAIALGIVSTVILLFIFSKDSAGSSFTLPLITDGSLQSAQVPSSVGFTFSVFGYRVVIPEYTPGWIYFWLLMAAACGFCISEEALNVWVGISFARKLTLDGNWQSFAKSFSENAPYIVSTVLWVYWGVCISDLIPFYLGKLFRKTRASEDICTQLGISKEQAASITRAVQKYGNLIGFVERFSLGVRNPTAFLAGAWSSREAEAEVGLSTDIHGGESFMAHCLQVSLRPGDRLLPFDPPRREIGCLDARLFILWLYFSGLDIEGVWYCSSQLQLLLTLLI